MKNIIAPVDFSPLSVNAANYAACMALTLKKDLVLLHVIQTPVVYGEVPMPLGEFESSALEATEALEQLAKRLQTSLPEPITIHTQVKIGSPVYELIQLSAAPETFAIAMGTRGAGAMERFFLGSTTSSVLQDADCPVMVVPKDFTFVKPQKIALASDLKDVVQCTPQKWIGNLLETYNAELEILHCDPDYAEFEPAIMQEGLLLDTLFNAQKHNFRFLHSGQTESSILEYAAANGVDILIIVAKKHGFIEDLFKHQHTGTFVRNAHMPVLVLKPTVS